MARTPFTVEVLTPEGEAFNDEVEMLSTRTTVGSIGVLAAALACALTIASSAHAQDAVAYQPALDAAWGPLDALDPLARQALVEGIAATIAHDNRVTVAEAELLRTICGVLRCPLPPMLERA